MRGGTLQWSPICIAPKSMWRTSASRIGVGNGLEITNSPGSIQAMPQLMIGPICPAARRTHASTTGS
jgi:hypothetical protein